VIIVPAVDIRDGKVVRLRQGRLQEEKVYGHDPAQAARRWAAEGARRLHVVDLDAALTGKPQFDVVAAVIAAVSIPVEVGGGLRVLENAMRYRQRGADRVIFGTAAVSDPGVVQQAVALWPEAVAVALDARGGKVAVAGWNEITSIDAVDLGRRVQSWGVRRLQYTDVVRDGTLVGPNIPELVELSQATGLALTAAGGISSLDDLQRLGALGDAIVDEVIVGRALYDGRFTLAEAEKAGHAAAR
jgi:phosphoribosylformimino-5-aminoimidazole carboxamide ribotide isomerase